MDEIINNNKKLIDFLNNYSEIDKPLILNKLSLLGLKNLENNLNHFYTLKDLDNLITNDTLITDNNENQNQNYYSNKTTNHTLNNNINNKDILNKNEKNNLNNELIINKIDSQIEQNKSYFQGKNNNFIPIKNFDEEIEKRQLDFIKKRIENNSVDEINIKKPNNNNNNKNLEKFINKPIENIKDLKNIESNLNTNFLKNKINFNNKNIKNFNNFDVNSSIGKKHLIPIKCCPICHCICNNFCNNCGCYKNVENNNFNTNNCDFNLKENNILQYPYLNYDYSRFEYPKEILKDKSYERAYEMKESYEHFK